ncbi:hypothetical protein ABIB59_001986 [Citrobacter sp. UYEF32]
MSHVFVYYRKSGTEQITENQQREIGIPAFIAVQWSLGNDLVLPVFLIVWKMAMR